MLLLQQRPSQANLVEAGALSDGRFRESELLARAPLIGDVVDDQRRAHALDRALLETVEGIVRGHEDHRRIGREGRAADAVLVDVVDVGAEILMPRVLRQVEQHREQLDAEIGVRLEPKTVDVLGELHAEIGAFEVGAEDLLDVAGDALVLERLRHRFADGEVLAVIDVEISARVVVQLALARDAVEGRRVEGERQDVVDGIAGQTGRERPIAIRLLGALGAIDALDEVANDIVRPTLPLRLGRLFDRDAVPHAGQLPLNARNYWPSSAQAALISGSISTHWPPRANAMGFALAASSPA